MMMKVMKVALVTIALLVASPVLLVFAVFLAPLALVAVPLVVVVGSVALLGADKPAMTGTLPVRATTRGSAIPLLSVGAATCD